jgi:hypothetical protein
MDIPGFTRLTVFSTTNSNIFFVLKLVKCTSSSPEYPSEAPEPLLWLDFETLLSKKNKCFRSNYFSVIEIKDRLNFMDDYI